MYHMLNKKNETNLSYISITWDKANRYNSLKILAQYSITKSSSLENILYSLKDIAVNHQTVSYST
jgi:hypothetical protein